MKENPVKVKPDTPAAAILGKEPKYTHTYCVDIIIVIIIMIIIIILYTQAVVIALIMSQRSAVFIFIYFIHSNYVHKIIAIANQTKKRASKLKFNFVALFLFDWQYKQQLFLYIHKQSCDDSSVLRCILAFFD